MVEGKSPLRSNKKQLLSENELAVATAGLFNLIASVRGDHWAKSPNECLVFSRPASQYLETINPKVSKQLMQLFMPISILMGLGMLVIGPLEVERRIAAQNEQANRIASRNARVSNGGQGFGGIQGQPQGVANAGNGYSHREVGEGRLPIDTGFDTDTLG